jgi:hypothetical protein
MSKRSEFIKKCMDDPKSVTQEELQDNYDAAIKKYYAAREDRLYKLFNGSDTAVWAHDEIIKQDKRIAELEKERFTFKMIISNPVMTDYDKYIHLRDMLKEQGE